MFSHISSSYQEMYQNVYYFSKIYNIAPFNTESIYTVTKAFNHIVSNIKRKILYIHTVDPYIISSTVNNLITNGNPQKPYILIAQYVLLYKWGDVTYGSNIIFGVIHN